MNDNEPKVASLAKEIYVHVKTELAEAAFLSLYMKYKSCLAAFFSVPDKLYH
jgi:hypothetical protein